MGFHLVTVLSKCSSLRKHREVHVHANTAHRQRLCGRHIKDNLVDDQICQSMVSLRLLCVSESMVRSSPL
jgi:hypothetical protein